MPRPKKAEPKQTKSEPQQTKTESQQTKAEPKPEQVKLLTGSELLEQVKGLGNLSKEEKAKACGYYTVTKNGLERVNMMKFLNELIDAEGIELDPTKNNDGHGGRSASYRIAVQSNGNLLIGSAYTRQLQVSPGDEFELILGRKHIHLKQIEAASSETAAPAIAS